MIFYLFLIIINNFAFLSIILYKIIVSMTGAIFSFWLQNHNKLAHLRVAHLRHVHCIKFLKKRLT